MLPQGFPKGRPRKAVAAMTDLTLKTVVGTGADTPVVSIIICSRNRAAGLGQTIATLAKITTNHNWEALLVDNASTDGTADVMRAAAQANPHLRSLLCAQIGLGAAREFARTNAIGRILAFTDDDCLIAPDFVDQLVQAFDRHPDAGVIGGWIGQYNPQHLAVTIDERTEVVRHEPKSFVRTGAFHGANLSFRADALTRAGGFDPGLGAGTPFPCEDIDAVARVLVQGHAAVFDPKVRVQHNHGRTSADWPNLMAGYTRGRGAYFATRLADLLTRQPCRALWLSKAATAVYFTDVTRVWQEAVFACRYARRHLPWRKGTTIYVTAGQAIATAASGWMTQAARRRLGKIWPRTDA
jgi:GT2 family glycosyltransferase